MKGQVIWTPGTSRSVSPRALPCWVSAMSQADRTRKTAVTATTPRARRISGGAGARLAVKAGQTVIAAAPRQVQTRCMAFEPTTGCGEKAMPMLEIPAISSTIRADLRRLGRQPAVTK
jgi:hypothetical protein